MAERSKAADQLQRILYLIPRVAREKEGVPIAELAAELDVTEHQVLDDIETVLAREYYYPAGSVLDIGILNDGERVFVHSRHFDRPLRFTPREALALALGMRTLAVENAETRESLLAHARSLEEALAGVQVEDLADAMAIEAGEGAEGRRALLEHAAKHQRAVAIRYIKPGDTEPPSERIVHPYALACAGLHWYVVGYCTQSRETRFFRIDRIFAARQLEESFEKPTDFDIAKYVERGWAYQSDDEIQATVRYSPHIARWMSEKGPSTALPDGGIEVNLPVADPRWLVRHVLEHAPDAEVVEPPELRTLVAESARALL